MAARRRGAADVVVLLAVRLAFFRAVFPVAALRTRFFPAAGRFVFAVARLVVARLEAARARVADRRVPARLRAGRAAFFLPPALRLAMMESFRNLDSFAISVVLSGAYRKSARPFIALDRSVNTRCQPNSRSAGPAYKCR